MLKLGLVRQSCPGVYHLLPLALKSLEKLVALIDTEMKAVGAAKMAMPILTPATLWKKTGGCNFHHLLSSLAEILILLMIV